MPSPIAALYIDLRASVGKFVTDLQNATGKLKQTERDFKRIGTQMSLSISAPLAAIAGSSLKAFATFESQLVKVGQKAGATAEEMNKLKDAAIKFAADTPFSTQQVAKGMQELAAAGMNASQIIEGMPGVLGLATVAELDVGEAAQTATDMMGAFGFQAKDLMMISDALAKTADASKVSVADLAETMKYAGSFAKLAGVSFEETAAAAAVMGDAGIRGSQAGTAMRMGFLRLLKPTKQAAGAMAEMGLSVKDFSDSSGKLKPLEQIIGTLATKNMTAAQAAKIFGVEASSAWAALVSGGVPAFKAYTDTIAKSTGYTEEFAKKLKETLGGKWEQMTGALNALGTAVGESIGRFAKPILDGLIVTLEKLTTVWQSLSQPMQNAIVMFASVVAAVGPLTLGLGVLVGLVGLLVSPIVILTAKLALLAAMVTYAWSAINSPEFKAGIEVIRQALNKFWEDFLRGCTVIKEAWTKFWDDFAKGVEVVKQKVGEMWESIKTFVDNTLGYLQKLGTGIKDALVGEFERTVDQLKGMTDEVTGFFAGMYDAVVGNSWVPDMVTEVGQWFTQLKPKMVDYSKMVCSETTKNFENMTTDIGKSVKQIPSFIQSMLSEGMSALGDLIGGDLGKGISSALGSLFSGENQGGIGGDLMEAIGSLIGGEKGLAGITSDLSEMLGMSTTDMMGYAGAVMNTVDAVTKLGKSTKDTISGIGEIGGTAIGAIFGGPAGAAIGNTLGKVVGDFLGGLFGGGPKNPMTIARKKIESFLEDTLKNFKIIDADGNLKELDNFIFGSSKRFNDPKWIEGFDKLDEKAKSTFIGLGEGLTKVLGVTEDVGAQIGLILAENLGGNIDNARLLVQGLGISFQQMEDALVQAGLNGEMSWHEVEVALQGVAEAYKPGLAATGAFVQAFDNVIKSGGKGREAIKGLKDIAIEAMEAGATSLQDLQARLRASGQFTEAEINALFTALAQRGITSLQQLAEVNDRVGGGIIADMESLGIQWEEVKKQVDEVAKSLKEIPANSNKVLQFKVETTMDEPTVQALNGGLFKSGGVSASGVTIPKFAKGGVVNSPSLFSSGGRLGLMGEAGPEAILPLKSIGGRLGVSTDGMGGGGVTYNIDARGAGAGVEKEIMRALREVENNAVSRSVKAMQEGRARGAYGR